VPPEVKKNAMETASQLEHVRIPNQTPLAYQNFRRVTTMPEACASQSRCVSRRPARTYLLNRSLEESGF